MTDQKIPKNEDRSDIDTLADVVPISLNSGDASTDLRQPDVTPIGNNASYSLGRLEQDPSILHAKWQSLDEEVSGRNGQISESQQQLEFAQQKTQQQEANLVGVTAEKDSLAEVRTTMQPKYHDDDHTIIEHKGERSAVRGDHKLLLKPKERLEKDLAQQIYSSTTSDQRLIELESKNVELEVHIQELRSYIDSRKLDRQELNAKSEEYENIISELQLKLEAANEHIAEMAVAQKERDLSMDKLAIAIGELRDRLRLYEPATAKQESRIAALERSLCVNEKTGTEDRGQVASSEELVKRFIVSDDDGSDEPICYPLSKKEIIIGRSHKSDIRINSMFISRIHARIRIKGSAVTIEDAGSKNGILVNSMHSTRHTLMHGDKLEIGTSKFRFLDKSSV